MDAVLADAEAESTPVQGLTSDCDQTGAHLLRMGPRFIAFFPTPDDTNLIGSKFYTINKIIL